MLLGFNTQCVAWSHDGHSAVGILTVDQLNADALLELGKIIDTQDEKALSKACNWPDELRETEEGDSTSPFHYINIPRGSLTYLKARDCPEKQCVTEAIKHYETQFIIAYVDAHREMGLINERKLDEIVEFVLHHHVYTIEEF